MKVPSINECLAVASSAKTPAGRWAFIDFLLAPPYVDECGCPCEGPPFISRETALELLAMPGEP